MKKHIFTLIILLSVFLSTQNASTFNGNRKGFVLSGGVGWTRYQAISNYHHNNVYTIGFIIGYGINDKNLITIDRSINVYKDKHYKTISLLMEGDGYNWYHYFSKNIKSKFIKFGYEPFDKIIYLGGGYMFSNNLQIGLTYSHLTKVDNKDRIKLLLSYIAF